MRRRIRGWLGPPRTNVYIDGFNLYHGAVENMGPGYKWLDLSVLCARLLPKDHIHRIRYFTAIVDARGDPQQPVRQQAYIRALNTIPNLTVHYGKFRTRNKRMRLAHPSPGGPKRVWIKRTEEKRSDVNLASYLLFDAAQGDCDVAVILTNDSDQKEPIEVIQREYGVSVGVVNPHPTATRSRDLQPTFFKQLRGSTVQACQFPATLQDLRGTIHKPAAW